FRHAASRNDLSGQASSQLPKSRVLASFLSVAESLICGPQAKPIRFDSSTLATRLSPLENLTQPHSVRLQVMLQPAFPCWAPAINRSTPQRHPPRVVESASRLSLAKT